MDDFTDLALIQHFGEQEEPEEMDSLSPYEDEMAEMFSMCSAEDALLQSLELEFFDRSVEENKKKDR